MSTLNNKMAATLKIFEGTRLYWLLLLVLGITLELVALFYQYRLEYWPCMLCIHVRIWIAGFLLCALAALLLHRFRPLRITFHLLITFIMIALSERAWQLVGIERGTISGSCTIESGLPEWFAVDQWLPAVFKIWEPCGYTPVLAFGVTMAEALLALFAVLVLVSLTMTIASLSNSQE